MTGDACPHPELWILTVLMSSYCLSAKCWKMHESGKENWQRKYFCGVKCHLILQHRMKSKAVPSVGHAAWFTNSRSVRCPVGATRRKRIRSDRRAADDKNLMTLPGGRMRMIAGGCWNGWRVKEKLPVWIQRQTPSLLSFFIKRILVRAGSGPQLRCSSLRLHGGLPWCIESFFFCSLCFVLDLLCFSFLFLFPSPSCPVLYLIL